MIRKIQLINFYNYTLSFFKKRLIELLGLLLITIFLVFTYSLISYSPENGTLIYNYGSLGEKNVFEKYSEIIADFFLQSFGLISFLFGVTLFSWGMDLLKNKKLKNIIFKFFFTITYIIFGCLFFYSSNNNSFWLQDNGNSGFIGEKSFDLISNYSFIVENAFLNPILLTITLIFFILGSGINLKSIFNKLINPFKKPPKDLKDLEKIEQDFDDLKVDKESETLDENPQQSFSFKTSDLKMTNKYILPDLSLLEKKQSEILKGNNIKRPDSSFIEKVLLDFGVQGKIKKVNTGPVVSLYEFEPAAGVKVSKIINLSDDIARNTSSISTRVSTIPGKNTVGIEIPNNKRENVILSEIISSDIFNKREIKLPMALGKSISGTPIVADLTSMPHLLIAGTTGSGKSVCINGIIVSLLYKHSPDNCKFILIDPKMLELSSYEGIPHLLTPVITDAKKATAALSWTVREMESRYKLMSLEGVRNIDGYNQKHKLKMPYIVVVVDEMSDLMLVSGKEIEGYVQKLSAMARAAGIHIIMATQRPSVDVITGTIKANFPTRISFQVSSKIDSKTILGEQGAEQLLGKGDMLFMSSANKIFRIHNPYVSENEIEKISSFLRTQGKPDYVDEITLVKNKDVKESITDEDQDELYEMALKIVRAERKASTSFLQRKLQIGYNRAARIIDQMEENKIVSKANHVGKREVL